MTMTAGHRQLPEEKSFRRLRRWWLLKAAAARHALPARRAS
jgi:hypothetical protein